MTMFLTNLTVQDVRGSNTGGRYAVLGQISAQKIVKTSERLVVNNSPV